MTSEPFTKTAFYVVAHADDWQLFMQPNAYRDLVDSSCKVIIIITTAGDAGFVEKFWQAREEGTKSSIKFCLAPITGISEASGEKEFHGHPINYWTANNCTCYFFRLPDGNLDGTGFLRHGYQSMGKLKAGEIKKISTVDNSTSYSTWADFLSTLQMIIEQESTELNERIIHYLNPDRNANPNDHKDHTATGQAVQDLPLIAQLPQALYVGYSLNKSDGDLDMEGMFWKVGMFSAYEKAVFDSIGYSTLRESIRTYSRWCTCKAHYILN
jgi:hypothetical protein